MNIYKFLFAFLFFMGCSSESEEPIALTPEIPKNLSYNPNNIIIEEGIDFESVKPAIEGDNSFIFAIKNSSEIGSFLSINSINGVVSIDGTNAIIGKYILDIEVKNLGGAVTFESAYTVNVNAKTLNIPKNLTYNPNNILIEEGIDFESVEPSIDGGQPLIFSLKNSAELGSFISLNSTNGIISVDGATSVIGEYVLNIEVKNEEGINLFENIFKITIEQHTVSVSNGYYISKTNSDPIDINILRSETVEADGFESQQRTGFYANFIYLDIDNYNIVQVDNNHIIKTYGGSSIITPLIADCGPQSYSIITIEENGTSFNTNAGLYKVTYDEMTGEVILFKVEQVGLIGTSIENGWVSSIELNLGSVTPNNASWEISDFILREGEFRIRQNCGWNIDRRIDTESSFASSNGYSIFTNFSGVTNDLKNGNDASDIHVYAKNENVPDQGIYTIKVDWNPSNGFQMILERTGDYINPFDPASFQWEIIGASTSTGWTTGTDLNYLGLSGTEHSWVGTYDLTSNDFRFRTNDSWDFSLGFNDAILTGSISDFSADGEGDFFLSTPANYTITITTNDEGNTWSINFQKN